MDDHDINVAADQSEELFKLHKIQLKFKNRELIDTRRELSHLATKFDLEKIEIGKQNEERTHVLESQVSNLQETLRLRDAEILATQNTLRLRSNDLEQVRNELVQAKERARLAEQQSYDAKINYKTRSEQLSREHKKNAIAFSQQLTIAFEKRLQKLKLRHTQDLFLAKKIVSNKLK